MSVLQSTVFWKDAVERAVKTFAQTVLATVSTGEIFESVVNIDWSNGLAIGATAVIVSLLTSVVTAGVANNGTASVVPEVVSTESR